MNANIVGLLDEAAARYGIDPNLAVAVAQQESGGNPTAVSSAGAQGVMQLMPATAIALGVSNPFNPAQNIDAGVRYLSQLISQFGGDVQLGLAAYNWGPSRVAKNGYSNWPAETVHYVSSILSRVGAAFTPPSSPASSTPAATTIEANLIDPGLIIDQASPADLSQAVPFSAGELMVGIAALGIIAYLVWRN